VWCAALTAESKMVLTEKNLWRDLSDIRLSLIFYLHSSGILLDLCYARHFLCMELISIVVFTYTVTDFSQYFLVLLSFRSWQNGEKTFFIEVIELDWSLERVLKVKSKDYRDPSQETTVI
jgi:hypothetical protein